MKRDPGAVRLLLFQKFREYLEGSNLVSKLQAKHDVLKKAIAEGEPFKVLWAFLPHQGHDSVVPEGQTWSSFSWCRDRFQTPELCALRLFPGFSLAGYKAELLTTR